MKKTLLVSAIALGLSSVALAGGLGEVPPVAPAAIAPVADFVPGIVVGIQGGYADSGMSAVENNNGFGYDVDHFNLNNIHDMHDIERLHIDYHDLHYAGAFQNGPVSKDTGLAGRIFIGYDFHKYFAVELGYFLMQPKAEVKSMGVYVDHFDTHHGLVNSPEHYTFDIHGYSDGKDEIRSQAFDLVGKVKAPINENFGLYAKAGVGYLMQRHSYSENGYMVNVHVPSQELPPDVKAYNYSETFNANKFDLVYGFGAYYTVNNWTVDLSYTRYNSGKTRIVDQKWQSNVDFYALGVSYKFNLPA